MFIKHNKRLTSAEEKLRMTFIDFKERTSGRYTSVELGKGAAYIVLCHAAFEEYFETVARLILTSAEDKFKKKKSLNRVLLFVTLHYAKDRGFPEQLSNKDFHSEFIMSAIGSYKAQLDRNNGLKEPNLCKIFYPLGYEFSNLDPLLMPELNSFGANRGDFAHNAISGKEFNPFDGLKQVQRILSLMGTFHQSIEAYGKLVR